MSAVADDHPAVKKLKKIFQRCDEIGLDRDDRMELAQYLLRRDIVSFKDLTEAQMDRMLDALEGFDLISHLLAVSGRR